MLKTLKDMFETLVPLAAVADPQAGEPRFDSPSW